MKTRLYALLATLGLVLSAGLFGEAAGQAKVVPAPEDRPSPTTIAATTLENGTYLKVVYGSPRKRDREIFGALVPYGQVWRAGANEATELTTTGEIRFGNQTLPAGTYALFTIPGKDAWTVILNSRLGQWGAYEYDEELDVLRVEVPAATTTDVYEAFTIAFEEAESPNSRTLSIQWDNVKASVPISAGSGQ